MPPLFNWILVSTPPGLPPVEVTYPASFVKKPMLEGSVWVQVELVQFQLNFPEAVVVANVIAGPVAVLPAIRVDVAGATFRYPLSFVN